MADLPQLKRLAWQLHEVDELSPADALNLYERNWWHFDRSGMEPAERALVQAPVDQPGGWRLLVRSDSSPPHRGHPRALDAEVPEANQSLAQARSRLSAATLALQSAPG